ncbi:hypothetical protein LPJ61_006773, partial [Coemansia biformis]
MLHALAAPLCGGSYAVSPFTSKWVLLTTSVGAATRSLTTKQRAAPPAGKSQRSAKAAASPRPLATSAQILPDGYVRPALYDENTPIPRCEAHPFTYHMGNFPWLLSAERQRVPMDDMDAQTGSAGGSP